MYKQTQSACELRLQEQIKNERLTLEAAQNAATSASKNLSRGQDSADPDTLRDALRAARDNLTRATAHFVEATLQAVVESAELGECESRLKIEAFSSIHIERARDFETTFYETTQLQMSRTKIPGGRRLLLTPGEWRAS